VEVELLEVSGPMPPVPAADGATVVVIDLPGAEGVRLGLALAERGYRPVPLYNAVPGPVVAPQTVEADAMTPTRGPSVVVDMGEIVAGLQVGATRLSQTRLRPDAPPAFLLDWRRRTGSGVAPRPGMFDNRSVSLPTDFPSANFLHSERVRTAVLIQPAPDPQPQADLAHTLRRWQEAGIDIRLAHPGAAAPPQPVTVGKPRWYQFVWHGVLARMGLRRHPLGGFGGFLPIPSAG
jgi:hypothetical protein